MEGGGAGAGRLGLNTPSGPAGGAWAVSNFLSTSKLNVRPGMAASYASAGARLKFCNNATLHAELLRWQATGFGPTAIPVTQTQADIGCAERTSAG